MLKIEIEKLFSQSKHLQDNQKLLAQNNKMEKVKENKSKKKKRLNDKLQINQEETQKKLKVHYKNIKRS
jgi:hypothetical protein